MAPKPKKQKDPLGKMQKRLGGHLSREELHNLNSDRGDRITGRKGRRRDQDGSPR